MTEEVTGQSLAARAAALGQKAGRRAPRPRDRTEPTARPVQPTLPPTIPPRARVTDPVTSHAAADAVVGVTDVQARILDVYRDLGPQTDEEMAGWYQGRVERNNYPPCSPSGLRTRRRELTDAGFVYDTRLRRRTESGRDAIVWSIR